MGYTFLTQTSRGIVALILRCLSISRTYPDPLVRQYVTDSFRFSLHEMSCINSFQISISKEYLLSVYYYASSKLFQFISKNHTRATIGTPSPRGCT